MDSTSGSIRLVPVVLPILPRSAEHGRRPPNWSVEWGVFEQGEVSKSSALLASMRHNGNEHCIRVQVAVRKLIATYSDIVRACSLPCLP